MQKQAKKSAKGQTQEMGEVETSPEAARKGEELKSDIDSLLDEIDDVLEQNAEAFVKGYVQGGGE